MDFALGMQNTTGEIYWAVSPGDEVDRMALLTGSSSVYLSVKCALAAAEKIGVQRSDWRNGLDTLGEAIRNRPTLFNMTKSPFLHGLVLPDPLRSRHG